LRLRIGGNHLLVHVGQERVVDLHVEAGIDDRLVFLAQAIGEREQELFSSDSARSWPPAARSRAHHRQERAWRLGLGGGRLQVGDVALDLGVE